MYITKDEFNQWKTEYVTKEFFTACNERSENAKETLATSAGVDPAQDNFMRGFLFAYREIQNFYVDDIKEEDN